MSTRSWFERRVPRALVLAVLNDSDIAVHPCAVRSPDSVVATGAESWWGPKGGA